MNYLIFTQYKNVYHVPHQVYRTLKEAKEALKIEARKNFSKIPKHSFKGLFHYDKAFGIACFKCDRPYKDRYYTFKQLLCK